MGAALAPIIVFCGTVASTVGPWAIEAAAVALVLHALVFIKNLIDAATADTANELEQSSEQMTEDAQNAGSMAMQIGMAKAMEARRQAADRRSGGRARACRRGRRGRGATPDLATGPEPAGATAGEGGRALAESPAAPAVAETATVDLSGEPANDNAQPSPIDLSGEPANDNALPGPEAAEQVLAATGTDGPVDVGPLQAPGSR